MGDFINISAAGGVNLFDDPRRIRDDELVRAKNLVPYVKGMLQKRPGMLATDVMPGSAGRVGVISPFPGADVISAEAAQLNISNMASGSVNTAFVTASEGVPFLVVFNRAVYAFPGGSSTAAGLVVTASTYGAFPTAATFAFNGTNNAFSPNVACAYRKRMVYAGLGPGYENHVVFSDSYDPATIGNDVRASTGRSFSLDATDGDKIIALIEITQSDVGSPTDRALLVLKEHSAYIITGEPHESTYSAVAPDTSLNDMVVSRINYSCGCISPQSVARTPYGTIWAGPDDVWFFAKGSLPVRIGTKLRPKLAGIPVNARPRIQAVYYNGFYRLACYSDGRGADLSTSPDEQWWLDLRDGPPQGHADARWWGPQTFSAVGRSAVGALQTYTGIDYMLLENRNGRTPGLYAALGQSMYECDVATSYDGIRTDTGDADYLINVDDTDTEITFELVTKEYDFGSGGLEKGFIGLRTNYWTSITDYLRLRADVDGGVTQDEATMLAEQTGVELSVDSLDTSYLHRKFQLGALYPTTRLAGVTYQFKLYDTAGYVIGAYNDTVVILSGATYYAVTLTRGSYDNLKALLDHLVARILAVTGISCSHDTTGPCTDVTTPRLLVTLTFGSAVTLCFASAGGAITAAQLRSARSLMGTLGWDTSANGASGTSQAAAIVVPWRRTTNWEFGGFEIEYDTFNRGPA